jgi:hypothetical protein
MAKKITLEQVRAAAPVSDPDRFREAETEEKGREPEPQTAAEASSPAAAPRRKRGQGRGSTPLGVSLYKDEVEALDAMVEELHRAGFAPATRSLVMREAFQRLKEEARGLEGSDLINFFISREAKRRSA